MTEIANRQHGVVARPQLLDVGVAEDAIDRAIWRGELLVVHRGVYRVGHRAPSRKSTYLAAVLACGERALLSGHAAAHLLGLVRSAPPLPEVWTRTERLIEGVSTRRLRRLDAVVDGFVFAGIPVTTVPVTLTALASSLGEEALARACHEAGVRYRTTPADVLAALERRPNVKGARKLRRVLVGDVRVTLSALERRFLKLLDENDLPLPETNKRVGTKRVDCRWPSHGLTVELDSYRYHSSRYAWEQDRRRDREARARGDQILRFTYADVFENPTPMLRELRHLLVDRPGQPAHTAGQPGQPPG
ncbi:MAG TPA: type IV toxin-antitoxin system AbiEi family antitoxin domain-containing protein [Solirubrobacteraceae bacterium]|jgi:very-short-patch-repair endonuclease